MFTKLLLNFSSQYIHLLQYDQKLYEKQKFLIWAEYIGNENAKSVNTKTELKKGHIFDK